MKSITYDTIDTSSTAISKSDVYFSAWVRKIGKALQKCIRHSNVTRASQLTWPIIIPVVFALLLEVRR